MPVLSTLSIEVEGEKIEFVDEAEHVGLLRSTSGNLAHISSRFAAHRKALAAVLPVGLARGHHGSPAAALRIHNLYATPVLLSGMGSIVLNKAETDMINTFIKQKTQNLQKLMDKTPASVVAFLGGTLPGYALLHLKQFSIFGMITRLQSTSILSKHGLQVFSIAKPSAQS